MSCWGEQRQGGGSSAAEAEHGNTVDAKEVGWMAAAGLGSRVTRCCHKEGPLWLSQLGWCKGAKT